MCGIMGYYSFGNAPPDKNKLQDMFTLLEVRGRDASGFAYLRDNELKVVKAPVKSSDLVQCDDWKNLHLPEMMIFHTRLKTQGEPANNMNNHPVFSKKGIAVVHNGIINNDKEIFGKNEKRDAEVDSEAILAILSNKKKTKKLNDRIKNVFDELDGGFAVASIDKEDPETLLLIRKDNPIELYYNSKDDILYFCSEREIMQEALEIRTKRSRGFNLGEYDYHSYTMEDNHALIINADGVQSYTKYKPKPSPWEYRSFWDEDTEDSMLVQCPYCYGMTRYYFGKLFNRCEMCFQPIEEEDVNV